MSRDHATGASKSLNKTITEIMDHLGHDHDRPKTELREFLYEKMGDLTERWFRKGFNRGHKQSFKEFADTGKVPTKLEFECKRSLCPRQSRELKLESKIDKRKRKDGSVSKSKAGKHK